MHSCYMYMLTGPGPQTNQTQLGGTCLGKADKPASIDDAARNRQAIWDGKQAERADVSVHRVRLTSKGGTRCQVVHSLRRAGCPSSLPFFASGVFTFALLHLRTPPIGA